MSKVARRAVSILLASSVALLGAACSGDGDVTTITYWSQWKDGENQQKVIAKAVEDWNEKMKDKKVKVEVEWQGRGMTSKLVPALNTNNVPDLVDSSFANLAPVLGVTGQGASMDKAYETEVEDGKKVIDVVPEKYTSGDTLKNDGGFWILPYSISTEAVWYNANNFPELASNPPKDWDSFIKILDEVKAKGEMAPVAVDGDISGYNLMWFVSMFVREHGAGSFKEMAADKSGEAWKDGRALAVAKRLEKLAQGGYFIDGYGASKFPAQQQKWATNQAGFLLCGSWIPTETEPYAEKPFEYSSFQLPTVQQEKSIVRTDFIGFAIPEKAKNKDYAAELAAFVLQKQYQQEFASEAKSLTVRTDVEPFGPMKTLVDAIEGADEIYRQNDGIVWSGYFDKTFQPINDGLLLGKTSAEDFINQMADAQKNYWKDQG